MEIEITGMDEENKPMKILKEKSATKHFISWCSKVLFVMDASEKRGYKKSHKSFVALTTIR